MKIYWFTEDCAGDFTRIIDNVRGTVSGASQVSFPIDFPHVECETLTEALPLLGVRMRVADQWVDKRSFIKALKSLIPAENLQEVASNWETIFAIAQLPGEMVDTTDPDLIAFVTGIGLTIDQVKNKMTEV